MTVRARLDPMKLTGKVQNGNIAVDLPEGTPVTIVDSPAAPPTSRVDAP